MTDWSAQRGELPVGCLLGFVVLLLISIFAMNVIPAQLRLGEFEKRINELADRANRREYTSARIKRDILDKAKELDLDVIPEKVIIDRNDRRIKINVTFDEEIRFPGYVWVRHHEYRIDRPLF